MPSSKNDTKRLTDAYSASRVCLDIRNRPVAPVKGLEATPCRSSLVAWLPLSSTLAEFDISRMMSIHQ